MELGHNIERRLISQKEAAVYLEYPTGQLEIWSSVAIFNACGSGGGSLLIVRISRAI
jgi:hypothetical protein